MKKALGIVCVMAPVILVMALGASEKGGMKINYATQLSPGETITIVRHLPAAEWDWGKLDKLPSYNPDSTDGWQVDLRSRDLSGLDLKGRERDLAFADFDSKTKWPANLKAVTSFEPAKLMELGKDPGLGIRELHKKGITGKGVGIAIIDQGLFIDHVEYKDRVKMYEEIHCAEEASMHGPAVASIAVGKTVGVAPEADLYYIAETHGTVSGPEQFEWDFGPLAQSIDRILEISKRLPKANRIRVISISVGWAPSQKGYEAVVKAVERAKKEGVFVVSSSLMETYRDQGMFFHGLGRDPLKDPNEPSSYAAGSWWQKMFFERGGVGRSMLLVPMDSRCTAAPNGPKDYAFYRQGGWSWSIPYIAGLYALACQVKPDVTPEGFWGAAMATGDSIKIEHSGKQYTLEKIVNPRKLIEKLRSSTSP
jgi:hypothetical protein